MSRRAAPPAAPQLPLVGLGATPVGGGLAGVRAGDAARPGRRTGAAAAVAGAPDHPAGDPAEHVDGLPPEAWAAALAAFPAMTAHRLRVLLRHLAPATAFAVAAGQAPPPSPIDRILLDRELARRWAAAARRPVEEVWQRCADLGIGVSVLGRPGYPWALALDRAAPAVLFHRGDLGVLDRRRAGVVGTRNATLAGRTTARRFGQALADEDVAVVSGLARGVDGAAHEGALASTAGAPVGVVASGLDVVYPREHRALWHRVAERGVLLSEAAPGTSPESHRFPLRNRILAALSEVLLVVESRASGGSLITAREARDRGIDVLVVPGATASRASEGTNLLARDGAGIALDPADVLVVLGLDSRRRGRGAPDPRVPPQPADRALLDLFDGAGLELEELVARSGRGVADVALALGRLEAAGWVLDTGGWFERVEAVPTWP